MMTFIFHSKNNWGWC